jgi:DNA-binding transcriptional LysR family regulator
VFQSPGPLRSPGGSLRDRAWANAASLRDLPGSARLRFRSTGQVGTIGERQTAIEQRLEDLGEHRRAGLTVPYHSLALRSVPGTRLILTLPARLLAEQHPDPGIRILPAPEEIRPLGYQMAWHPRLDDDLGQRWLRNAIRAVTSELPEPAQH